MIFAPDCSVFRLGDWDEEGEAQRLLPPYEPLLQAKRGNLVLFDFLSFQ